MMDMMEKNYKKIYISRGQPINAFGNIHMINIKIEIPSKFAWKHLNFLVDQKYL